MPKKSPATPGSRIWMIKDSRMTDSTFGNEDTSTGIPRYKTVPWRFFFLGLLTTIMTFMEESHVYSFVGKRMFMIAQALVGISRCAFSKSVETFPYRGNYCLVLFLGK